MSVLKIAACFTLFFSGAWFCASLIDADYFGVGMSGLSAIYLVLYLFISDSES